MVMKKLIGLTNEEVIDRVKKGLVNYDSSVKTKKISTIILTNIFTLFNLLNLGLGLCIFLVGSYKNLLFLGVVFCNTLISIIQEVRSKKVIDKLSVTVSTKVNVIRNNIEKQIDINEIVMDDLLLLKSGNQVIVDSIIEDGNVEVNESFITGESEMITYKKGDLLKSGSFIVSGICKAKVIHIGIDNYTSLISKDAKYIKKINSVLLNSLTKIIKIISIIIIPLGLLLFYSQLNIADNNFNNAVINTVAALIAMIPEGLVLLTSTVLAVSIIRLSKYNVLVQELYCIETLARVNTLCLDKTGTITEGNLEFEKYIPLNNSYEIEKILSNLCYHLDDNKTIKAIKLKYHNDHSYKVNELIHFSPTNKYSGVKFIEGTYIIGAPNVIYKGKIKEMDNYKEYRILLLGKLTNDKLEPIALLLLKDKIRFEAKKTLDYFKAEGVDIKIISGDSSETVNEIMKRIGFKNLKYIDILENTNLDEIAESYNIFGRVSPIQKKQLIIALKKNNTVAMMGDGVNDVLALKEADCSIAINNEIDATRNVSQIVLLDNNFDSLPLIVKEGRRTINNIERSASLFLSKTTYAILLAIFFTIFNLSYPFIPIQLTLISTFTIGIPSFVLALEPNNNRVIGSFLKNILLKSLPTGITIFVDIIILSILSKYINVSTLSVIITGFVMFRLLFKISYPFTKIRIYLFTLMLICFIIGIVLFKDLFSLMPLNKNMILILIILMLFSIVFYELITKIIGKMKRG